MGVAERYARVRADVDKACKDAGRDPAEVLLLAVSKTVGCPEIREAMGAGARSFGENRPDPLAQKSAEIPEADWHFIGNIQSRRIRDIVPAASLIHSVFRPEHLARIDAEAQKLGKIQRILVEVNVSGEESKSGLAPDELSSFIEAADAFEHIEVAGLMTMAPRADEDAVRLSFSGLARLRSELDGMPLEKHGNLRLSELSMGMSEDWRVAIEYGATIVRIGRAIFSEEFE